MAEDSGRIRAVFLDRDGTLNVETHYLHEPEKLVFFPDTAAALRLLHGAGFKLIVVTNQAGVARGYYTEQDVVNFHRYFNRELEKQGAHIDAFYYCPHHPEHGIGKYRTVCHCRKPDTGMFEQAERDLPLPLDREHSFMIGDKRIDTEAGHNFGVRSILVGTGYGAGIRQEDLAKHLVGPDGRPLDGSYDSYAENLLKAAEQILACTH
jgi:D-glycero-D-manno-heptose 1,7-bisphosphate phosphatase